MHNFEKMTISELLQGNGYDCACKKHHSVNLKHVFLSSGAIQELPKLLEVYGAKRPFLIFDKNTRKAAGDLACQVLKQAGIAYGAYCFPQAAVEPDEYSTGQVIFAFDPACDMLIAVGSGTINDICRLVAKASGRNYIVVATAPSMDGYSSSSSSMIVEGVKTTLYSVCPVGIIGDLDVLAKAPMRMLQAGLGDVLAKYISLCEWEISNIVTDEYYCENVASLMRQAVRKCKAAAPGLTKREPETVRTVMEGLIMAGIAMSFAGISRPASGLEHSLSHIWDMQALQTHTKPELHGIQVGIGTVLTLRMYEWLREQQPSREKAQTAFANFDDNQWQKRVERIFGSTAPDIIRHAHEENTHDPVRHAALLDRIIENWPTLLRIMQELPSSEEIIDLLHLVGAPALPQELGMSDEKVRDALYGSMDIRDKYIGSRFLWELGLLDEAAALVFCK